MIIFQITLTGIMLQHLAMLKRQAESERSAYDALRWDGRYVTTTQSLIRQGLATHERPTNKDYLSTGLYKFKDKARRFPYEITPKGLVALQLAAYDMKEFIDQINQKALPPGERYSEVYDIAGHPGLHTHQGEKVDHTGTTESGARVKRQGKR